MTDAKEAARRAYKEGWRTARGTESFDPIHERTMESNFEEWWGREFE